MLSTANNGDSQEKQRKGGSRRWHVCVGVGDTGGVHRVWGRRVSGGLVGWWWVSQPRKRSITRPVSGTHPSRVLTARRPMTDLSVAGACSSHPNPAPPLSPPPPPTPTQPRNTTPGMVVLPPPPAGFDGFRLLSGSRNQFSEASDSGRTQDHYVPYKRPTGPLFAKP